MNLEEIRELARIMSDHGLTSLEVKEKEKTIKLEKNCPPVAVVSPSSPFSGRAATDTQPSEKPAADRKDGSVITAPAVGVFYASASPESKPFVTVGSQVKKGDVLCIIEAMKLMNEITAEKDGTILEVCVANEQLVEFGQPLFVMR